jgi:hypothetical protein
MARSVSVTNDIQCPSCFGTIGWNGDRRERGYVIEITGIVTSDIFLGRHVTGNDVAVNLFGARGLC